MGVDAALTPKVLAVEAGGDVTAQLEFRNAGTVIDQFSFEVLGAAAPWATVTPSTRSLFPGATGLVAVRFEAPRSSDLPSAAIPFAVHVRSKEDPDGSDVVEGSLTVGPFLDLQAEVRPRTSEGSRHGDHRVVLDNFGNEPAHVTLSAVDPDEHLRFDFRPPELDVPAGESKVVELRARPHERFAVGPARTRPFEVVVSSPRGAPLRLPATLLQRPLVPRWGVRAALAGLAAVAAGAMWLALVKPELKTQALNAVAEPIARQEIVLNNVFQQQGLPSPFPDTSPEPERGDGGEQQAVSAFTATTTPQAPPVTPASPPPSALAPFDTRLSTTGKDVQDSYAVKENKVVSITDVLLQTTGNEAGFVELRRGDFVIMRQALADFRDLDLHFLSPIVFRAGDRLLLSLECTNKGSEACVASVYVSGYMSEGT